MPYDLKSIDPRGIGINPEVLQMWTKYMPKGNLSGTGANLCGGIAGSSA